MHSSLITGLHLSVHSCDTPGGLKAHIIALHKVQTQHRVSGYYLVTTVSVKCTAEGFNRDLKENETMTTTCCSSKVLKENQCSSRATMAVETCHRGIVALSVTYVQQEGDVKPVQPVSSDQTDANSFNNPIKRKVDKIQLTTTLGARTSCNVTHACRKKRRMRLTRQCFEPLMLIT